MRRWLCMIWVCGVAFIASAQDIPPVTEQQLENMSENEVEDDTYLQTWERLKHDPLNLNSADVSELREAGILNDWQIENLLVYRKLLGKLISLFELQAIPGWDLITIRKLLPFVTINEKVSLPLSIRQRLKKGDHGILLRISQSMGAQPAANYLGSSQRILFRYRYSFKNNLQFGIIGDKDEGERFFSGAQKIGFDFYSFHFFARKVGRVEAIAVGDYTVNMGQGLIHWQALAFKKGGEATSIKRQSPVLRAYNSAGEFYFNRGAAITIRQRRSLLTTFFSRRRLSANVETDINSNHHYISSLLRSGYHRTMSEVGDRYNITHTSIGANVNHKRERLQVAGSAIYHHFSLPIRKKEEPYNLYAIRGNTWWNVSVDYSYTWKNMHFFGEVAADKHFNSAVIHGLLWSVDPIADIAILHRSISAPYRAVFGNAFTDATEPANEAGTYVGLSLRPVHGWRIEAYFDLFKSNWLKYRVDAPSAGMDGMFQVIYTPNKRVEWSSRYRSGISSGNPPGDTAAINYPVGMPRQNWRTQVIFRIDDRTTIRNRVELAWYVKKYQWKENGYLVYLDVSHRFRKKPVKVALRLQYYETGGYNSRIFAYEHDVLFSNSIPSFAGSGVRYYLIFNHQITKRLGAWVRWAQTLQRTAGVVADTAEKVGKQELKLQFYLLI